MTFAGSARITAAQVASDRAGAQLADAHKREALEAYCAAGDLVTTRLSEAQVTTLRVRWLQAGLQRLVEATQKR